ncbi:MAG: SsrA-binding protein SmpB [Alphaproteobacteria bacterium]|jgi:SsrA-binding protein|nr:SsrA-binding protein SmpB [Alphaproteobacteria bacterium]
MAVKKKGPRAAAENRRARHDYLIGETIETGMVLMGSEVKSLRLGHATLAESHAGPKDGAIWLLNCHIPPYQQAGREGHEAKRPRKLLLRKKEMVRLLEAVKQKGVTLVPLKIYFNDRGIAKLLLGLAKGKKQHDKRQADKDRDWKRQQGRLMREKG